MLDSVGNQFNPASARPMRADKANFISYLERFNRIGKATETFTENGIRYYVNDYWTSAQRQANRLHEISYRACFKAELPAFFISALTAAGDIVYDPFMGRGTTPLQAALMGRKPIGNDINPLSEMLLRPRFTPPKLAEVATRLDEIDWQRDTPIDKSLLVFYHPATLKQIIALKHWLAERNHRKNGLDNIDDWIRMVALNRLTGHSSGFFSVYTLPPNQAVSVERQAKINAHRKQTPPKRYVKSIILKKTKVLISQSEGFYCPDALLGKSPADKTAFIDSGCVDLVVTSPPFLDIVQYHKDNWLRCWFASIAADAVPISMHKSIAAWTEFVRKTLSELARVMKAGGHLAFEVGEVRKGKILLEKYVIQAAQNLPFDILGVMVNQQNFTKTANCWGINNNHKGTNSNRIILMKRY
ncbi:MAG: DNA methyltransferase [Alphaproteobacteria bacterium]|nr:DNA methyltransferase [Alphaproteobacteria bacterium]